MTIARRELLRHAGTLAALAPMDHAWSQAAALSCAASPECRNDCGPTASATEGPFYVANAPAASDINPGQAPGTPMRIGGVVHSESNANPIRGARVEIWHADAHGQYHPADNGDSSAYRRGEINLRGVASTDDAGRYAFTSIVPGHYGDRRRHIHWKVSAPGHRALTTQSYWSDERDTPRDRGDSTDRRVEACRWVHFQDRDGAAIGLFDIVLRKLR